MIKKSIIIGAATLLVAGVFFGRDAFSYIGTSYGWVKETVKEHVPIEFEIERARKMVENLVPDIRRNMHIIAREEVELARLEKQIDQQAGALGSQKAQIMRLTTDLKSGGERFEYASRSYSRDQVKADLAGRFERFKTSEATLANLEQIYQARQRSLDAARQKLETMLVQKRQLEVEVENLQARLKMLEAAQAAGDYRFDDSRLARVKELITELNTRLEVTERLTGSDGLLNDSIPLEDPVSEDIVNEVTEYFATGPSAANVAQVPEK